MSSNKKTFQRPTKRVLTGETREEEEARLAAEIAAHPVTKCEPGEYKSTASRQGWRKKPFMSQADQANAERIAKKMRKS
ncbi:MAG: hypothetical protein QNK17_00920 [Hyphomicrobiaceae bacterium]|nr:hypothetical protein [Hyphomicrobiaceae bacterium]MDX2448982.1 hypothetical protein [Hyphomicrobiaceae bacterium]